MFKLWRGSLSSCVGKSLEEGDGEGCELERVWRVTFKLGERVEKVDVAPKDYVVPPE